MMVPTLILWGRDDALVPVEAAHWYAKHLPNATTVIYRGIGHLPHEEAPDQSATDLRKWMVAQGADRGGTD